MASTRMRSALDAMIDEAMRQGAQPSDIVCELAEQILRIGRHVHRGRRPTRNSTFKRRGTLPPLPETAQAGDAER